MSKYIIKGRVKGGAGRWLTPDWLSAYDTKKEAQKKADTLNRFGTGLCEYKVFRTESVETAETEEV